MSEGKWLPCGYPELNAARSAACTTNALQWPAEKPAIALYVAICVCEVRNRPGTCSLNIKRALPLNQPVDIEFTPEKPGDIAFVCGMGMLSGTFVVE